MKLQFTKDMLEYVEPRYEKKFSEVLDEQTIKKYQSLNKFKVSGNIFETGQTIDNKTHYLMRLIAQFYLDKAFDAMLIDKEDSNVCENLNEGNIGTVGRIIKTWTGANIEDNDELMSGRWTFEPRMASFKSDEIKSPVFVETSLDAVCSHHFIRFGDDNSDSESFVVVGYYPDEEFGGISKINRYVRWCATRGWLQESLTNYIGNKIKKKFKTDSVYVGIFNAKHGCASFRGALDRNASTSTVFISGKFKENLNLIPQKYRG